MALRDWAPVPSRRASPGRPAGSRRTVRFEERICIKRRILVSAPRDVRLDAPRIRIRRAIIDRIERRGHEPQVFLDARGGSGLAAGAGWRLEEVERVARRRVGAIEGRLAEFVARNL